ncbi:MAG: hypothetical protein Q9195_007787 [Heterodermia aff. obscurata]
MTADKNHGLSWPRTDLTRWRLTSTDGAHRWVYLSKEDSEQHSQSTAERYFLGILKDLQLKAGHWGCSFGGPSFILPGLVFALYVTNTPILPEWKIEMRAYIAHHVNSDGGWGLFPRADTTVWATALYYVLLRLLGVEALDPLAAQARKRLLALGGAIGVPQWGKFWLCVLNLYQWEGVNPVPPELCTVAATDMKVLPSMILKLGYPLLRIWDTYLRPAWLHRQINDRLRGLIRLHDENTAYNNMVSTDQGLIMAILYFDEGEESISLAKHREVFPNFLWQCAEGMTVSSTDGAQVWDTALSVLAVVEGGLVQYAHFREAMLKALGFLERQQLREDLADPYRQQRKGGWSFSTKVNGFLASDCSGEAMKAVLLLQEECGLPQVISNSRLHACVDTLLLMQNTDGGFASFEHARAGAWLEKLNPSEVFHQCMVEHSYTECTSTVLTSLALFRRHFPYYRADAIEATISRAADFVRASQRLDGSWEGAWGICFTYAMFFALDALETVQETFQTSRDVRKACEWLVSKQKDDGGWGEHYSSCELREYMQDEMSQVVNTAWAVMALMSARYPERARIERGLQLIQKRQQPNGEWLQENLEGVVSRTIVIGYPNYKFYFPIRALGKYEHVYLPWLKEFNDSQKKAL